MGWRDVIPFCKRKMSASARYWIIIGCVLLLVLLFVLGLWWLSSGGCSRCNKEGLGEELVTRLVMERVGEELVTGLGTL